MRIFIALLLYCIFLSCHPTSRMGKDKLGEDGKIISGTALKRCDPPPKTYAKGLDLKVSTQVDSLRYVPLNKMELALSQTVTKLASYTSEGLDMGLYLFYICQMANNRGLSSEQTTEIISKAMDSWNNNEELKKK